MELGLRGRVAVVLGAAGGLGAATARALSKEGARTVACDINTAALEDLAEQCRDRYEHATYPLPFDLTSLSDIDEAVDQVERDIGPVEILVNLTGGPPPSAAAGLGADVWADNFGALVAPVLHIANRVLPNMLAAKWGRIITSTSSGVVAPIPDLAISNGLRSALVGWSKTLASEVARDGITVNVLVPGRIGTTRITQLDRARGEREQKSVEEVAAASIKSIPVGRYGEPEEFGAVAAFICGTPASYITGSMIRVDGGLLANV